jgi:hypothetical protein
MKIDESPYRISAKFVHKSFYGVKGTILFWSYANGALLRINVRG